MATFPEFALRVILGRENNPRFEIALYHGNRELVAEGYKRYPAYRGNWQLRSTRASIETRFGPFPDGARFDQAKLLANGEAIEEFPLTGTVVPADGVFEFSPVVKAVDEVAMVD